MNITNEDLKQLAAYDTLTAEEKWSVTSNEWPVKKLKPYNAFPLYP